MNAQVRHGFCIAIGQALLEGCERHEVPLEALNRMIGPEGSETMDAITLLIEADYRSASVPQVDEHLHRDAASIESNDIVLVPDMDATAITAFAKKQCKLTSLDRDYENWDHLTGLDKKPISGRSKKFEVLTWKPGRDVSSNEVREHFQEKGFYGHTAAFTAWVAQHSPEGYHASIPEDNACWCGSDGDLCAPYSYFDGGFRRLSHLWVGCDWFDCWCFVAFREL